MSKYALTFILSLLLGACAESNKNQTEQSIGSNLPVNPKELVVSRHSYQQKLAGFWLGQSIANWTGLVTEMDKIGGAGPYGEFYTRDDWGKPDQPSIWGQGIPSNLSPVIGWVLEDENGIWGSDDDTDIEYLYQQLLYEHNTSILTPQQIRDGWLKHIYTDATTPYVNKEGNKENYLWVSNQQAFDLMQSGMLPPDTGAPQNNPHFDMIDAQLTTEIFGFFAPGRPDVALQMAYLPIRTTARENAAWAAEFYVIMYSLAPLVDPALSRKQQIMWMAEQARQRLPENSYTAHMYDFVLAQYQSAIPWETTRDQLYQRYQVEQQDGYDITTKQLYCNGCFASGINFAASLVSLFYGEGDFKNTVKTAVLMGWDSDNPAATWGGLLGFMYGKAGIEAEFEQTLSNRFNIHRTRTNFANDGIDNFEAMAQKGIAIIDNVVLTQMGGSIDLANDQWRIPLTKKPILKALD